MAAEDGERSRSWRGPAWQWDGQAYPFWALVIIAADVVALWGLCAYGSRENLDAV
jgi:hypothetical protein